MPQPLPLHLLWKLLYRACLMIITLKNYKIFLKSTTKTSSRYHNDKWEWRLCCKTRIHKINRVVSCYCASTNVFVNTYEYILPIFQTCTLKTSRYIEFGFLVWESAKQKMISVIELISPLAVLVRKSVMKSHVRWLPLVLSP